MNEGVGVMEGKEFVCHLCVSLLVGTAEGDGWVKKGMHSVRVELNEIKEESRRLKYEVEQERCESLRATQGKVMKSMMRGEVVAGDRLEGKVRREEGEKQMNCQQLSAAGVEGSERQNGNENQCED